MNRNTLIFGKLDLLLSAYCFYVLLRAIRMNVSIRYIYVIICLSMLYLVFRNIPRKVFILLLYVLPVYAFIQCISGYCNLQNPWYGLSDNQGFFNNTGIFAGFVSLGIVVAVGILLFVKSRKWFVNKILMSIIVILLSIQLIYSHSRAAWLAVLLGSGFLIYFKFGNKIFINKYLIISILFVITGLLACKMYNFKKDSADGRVLIWMVSSRLIGENPVFGIGPDGFQANYMLKQAEYFREHPDSQYAYLADDTAVPFNELLKIEIEQGIVGLCLALLIIYQVFNIKNIEYKEIIIQYQSLFMALMVFSCFSFPLDFTHLQIVAVICLSVMAKSQKKRCLTIHPVLKASLIGLYTLIVCFSSISLINHQQAITKWHKLSVFRSDKKLLKMKELYPKLKNDLFFLYDLGSSYAAVSDYPKSVEILDRAKKLFPTSQVMIRLGDAYEKTKQYDRALNSYETAAFMKPSLFEPQYRMAKLYCSRGDIQKAVILAKGLLNKKVKVDNPRIYRMKREMKEIIDSGAGNIMIM